MWRLGKNEVFTGGMGSYSTICLAISFLQVSLCFNIHVTSLIANSRTQQHPKIRNNEIDPMKNLGILLIEFFELYGLVFNWEDLGISIREGGSYFDKRDRNWYKSGYQPNFAIEDPQDQRKFAFRRNQSNVTLTEPATSERHLEGNL
jgi:non-canonical poly(A) RNA polymerase PAPD5/7